MFLDGPMQAERNRGKKLNKKRDKNRIKYGAELSFLDWLLKDWDLKRIKTYFYKSSKGPNTIMNT